MKKYEPHPLAELFPTIPSQDKNKLIADIKANGLNHPITLFEGKILDGRHRYEACLWSKTEPRFVDFGGKDALSFVLSANLHRRHLDTAQRAMVASKIANMKPGKPSSLNSGNSAIKQSEAAKTLNVSTDSVKVATKILHESPRLANQVSAGKVSLHAAEKIIKEEKSKPSIPITLLDDMGFPIPERAKKTWERRQEIQDILTILTKLKSKLAIASDDKDPLFASINFNSAMAHLDQLFADIKRAKPYAVCPSCQGKLPDKCGLCKGSGIAGKFGYDNADPKWKKARESQIK